MDRKKVCNILSIIGVILVIGCAIGDIIVINFCGATPTKLSQSIWCLNVIMWVGIWASANHWADFYKDAYERLSKVYDKLSEQYDEVLKTAEDVNKNNIKQNKLCDEVNKNNKEILSKWNEALEECKALHKDRSDLLLALGEYEPHHPLIEKIIEDFYKKHPEKKGKENTTDKISE